MRSYGQYCALARTLDVIGDRWTLLIIRELFAHDCRYSDLRDALPGIATNLLAERLRHLQHHTVIESYDAPAPVRATVYRLTERGRELGPALAALVAWGGPLLADQGDDEFRTHWLALGLPTFFQGVDFAGIAPLEVVIRTGDEPATLIVGHNGVQVTMGASTSSAAATIEGSPDGVFAMLTGRDRKDDLPDVQIAGPSDAVRRLHLLSRRARVSQPH
ncbi:MAG TPA: helix-turn-helix domain-containing protein [Jiangellaceae bacterium]